MSCKMYTTIQFYLPEQLIILDDLILSSIFCLEIICGKSYFNVIESHLFAYNMQLE